MTSKQKLSIKALRTIGWTYARIAETIGVSADTVKSFCLRQKIIIRENIDVAGNALCKHCGKLLQQATGGRVRVFCSNKCRYDWWNIYRPFLSKKNTAVIACLHCKIPFAVYSIGSRKYCSIACHADFRRSKNKGSSA